MMCHHVVEHVLELRLAGHAYAEVDTALIFDKAGALTGVEVEAIGQGWVDAMSVAKSADLHSPEWHFAHAIISAARAWLATDEGEAAEHVAMVDAVTASIAEQAAQSRSETMYGRDVT